ncbi:hypothetical protein [Thermoactinomyces mirandus]|nr:hypothetical protein [Thermoactinomyces mirandus]
MIARIIVANAAATTSAHEQELLLFNRIQFMNPALQIIDRNIDASR